MKTRIEKQKTNMLNQRSAFTSLRISKDFSSSIIQIQMKGWNITKALKRPMIKEVSTSFLSRPYKGNKYSPGKEETRG